MLGNRNSNEFLSNYENNAINQNFVTEEIVEQEKSLYKKNQNRTDVHCSW